MLKRSASSAFCWAEVCGRGPQLHTGDMESRRDRTGCAPVPIAKIGKKTTEDLGVYECRNRIFPIPAFSYGLRLFLICCKHLVQCGPGDPQLPCQRRLTDFPALVAVIVPGQVRDGGRLSPLVFPLALCYSDSLSLAFQEVCPLKFVNGGNDRNNQRRLNAPHCPPASGSVFSRHCSAESAVHFPS